MAHLGQDRVQMIPSRCARYASRGDSPSGEEVEDAQVEAAAPAVPVTKVSHRDIRRKHGLLTRPSSRRRAGRGQGAARGRRGRAAGDELISNFTGQSPHKDTLADINSYARS